MAVAFERMTAEQYVGVAGQLPRFTQLIDGEVVLNQPTLRHQDVVLRVAMALATWAGAQPGRGRAGISPNVVLDDRNVYAPDAWWAGEARKPPPDADYLADLPDLVVEVRSPSTWRYDVHIKKAVYEGHGLPELWLVDIDARAVLVFRRSSAEATQFDVTLEVTARDHHTLTSPLLPGFSLDVAALFGA